MPVLRTRDAGNVDESEHDTVAPFVAVTIWRKPHKIMRFISFAGDLTLDKGLPIDNGLDVLGKVRQSKAAGEIGDRPPSIARDNVEYTLDGRRKASDRQI